MMEDGQLSRGTLRAGGASKSCHPAFVLLFPSLRGRSRSQIDDLEDLKFGVQPFGNMWRDCLENEHVC